jgi:hypothetical protein
METISRNYGVAVGPSAPNYGKGSSTGVRYRSINSVDRRAGLADRRLATLFCRWRPAGSEKWNLEYEVSLLPSIYG